MEKMFSMEINQENKMNWQEINFNNNTEKGNYKEKIDLNNHHNQTVMKTKDLQLLHETNLGNHNENDAAEAASNMSSSSTNNSTDNLSYIIEEVLVLQGNLSDENISVNSDDCIYAYRGADFDIPLDQRGGGGNGVGISGGGGNGLNSIDDETDFLEMDFDPDPISEIDHINESASLADVNAENIYQEKMEKTMIFSKNLEQDLICSNNDHHQEFFSSANKSNMVENNGDNTEEAVVGRQTGAKPKKVSNIEKIIKVSTRNAKKEEHLPLVMNANEKQNESYVDADEICLDCLENEFLSSTIGKNIESPHCSKCNSYRVNRSRSNGIFTHSNTFKGHNFSSPLLDNYCDSPKAIFNKNPQDITQSERLLHANNDYEKNTVSFLNIEGDEKIVIQALVKCDLRMEKLDVSFNRDIIRNYFNMRRKIFPDVPEFIVYMSKRNCDYKSIIKLIKAAITTFDGLEIKFIPVNPQNSTTELVELNAIDILQYWTRKSDLEKLKKLGKKFSQMNVLGKITNLIRQAQQRNNDVLNEIIVIPQYYKTGFISINKK